MSIDLNKNGKDDIEELLEDMHEKFEQAAQSTDAIVQDFVQTSVAPLEEAMGVDINGDGAVGCAQ